MSIYTQIVTVLGHGFELSHSEYRRKRLDRVRSSRFLTPLGSAPSCSSRIRHTDLHESVFRSLLFPKEALLISNQTHVHGSFILVFSLNERVGNDSFLSRLHVECLEQFAVLQFVQSTACMSLGDPAGLQPERTYAEVNPTGFYCLR